MLYDYLMVGCGIATMYFVDTYLQKTDKVIILEKNDIIGGRVGSYQFEGHEVVTGAGVFRENDIHMKKFYEKLTNDILTLHPSHVDYSLIHENAETFLLFMNYLKYTAKHINRTYRSKYSIKQHLNKHFEKSDVSRLLSISGYQDFIDADIIDTAEDYQLEDNGGLTNVSFPSWRRLINSWSEKYQHLVITNEEVIKIDKQTVITKNGSQYKAKKIILDIPLTPLKRLYPSKDIYNHIGSVKFMRLYIKTDKKLPINSKGMVLAPKPLQKIITIDDNIYMISYSDGINAEKINKMTKNKLTTLINQMFNINIKILNIHKIYWEEGVHFYKPLPMKFKDRSQFIDQARHPEKNVYAIGSMLSRNQGWTQGAADSAIELSKLLNI